MPARCPGCHRCDGLLHHWKSAVDDETGDSVFVCRHCPATFTVFDVEPNETQQDLFGEIEPGPCQTDAAVIVNYRSGDSELYDVDGQTRFRRCLWCGQVVLEGDADPTVCVCDRVRCQAREKSWRAQHDIETKGREIVIENPLYF